MPPSRVMSLRWTSNDLLSLQKPQHLLRYRRAKSMTMIWTFPVAINQRTNHTTIALLIAVQLADATRGIMAAGSQEEVALPTMTTAASHRVDRAGVCTQAAHTLAAHTPVAHTLVSTQAREKTSKAVATAVVITQAVASSAKAIWVH